jgi:hypothetical protein
MSAQPRGPSRHLRDWRSFVIETLLLVELMVIIGVQGVNSSHSLSAGMVIAGLVATILRILWRHQNGPSVVVETNSSADKELHVENSATGSDKSVSEPFDAATAEISAKQNESVESTRPADSDSLPDAPSAGRINAKRSTMPSNAMEAHSRGTR